MHLSAVEIKARIIRRMVRWRKWGGSHTENLVGGLPAHLRGAQETREAIEEMVRDGWLVPAKKTREEHYALNPEKTAEILAFYEAYASRDADP
jgi:hypothetical protein